MAIILSIDPGCRNTGYSVTQDSELIYFESMVTESEDFYTPFYLREHYNKFDELVTKFDPDLIALEGPSIASNNYQFAIGGMHGIYTLVSLNLELPCIIIPPAKWKKLIVGKGNATKSEISKAVKPLFTLPNRLKQDIIDSLAINLFAQKTVELLEKQREPSKLEVELILSSKGVLGSSHLNFNLDYYGKGTIKRT